MTDNTQQFPPPPPQGQPFTDAPPPADKPKMGRGKKIGLWAGGALVAFAAIGALGGDPETEPTATPAAVSSSSRALSAPVAENTTTADKAAAEKEAAEKAAEEKAAAEKEAAEKEAAEKAAEEKAAAEKAAAEKAAAEKAEAEKEAAEKAANAMTKSQEQAVRQAEQYLDYTAFSRSGLIEQLEFEGFSRADATYAVDHITVDWKKQAAKKAEEYLDYTAFSRSGLIKQLEFEGFTSSQAKYGADAVGL